MVFPSLPGVTVTEPEPTLIVIGSETGRGPRVGDVFGSSMDERGSHFCRVVSKIMKSISPGFSITLGQMRDRFQLHGQREFGCEKKAITVICCTYSGLKFVCCADRLSTFSPLEKGQSRGFAVGSCNELGGSRVARQYYVNAHSRRLARGKSNLAGLIFSERSDPFLSRCHLGSRSGHGRAGGWKLLLCNIEYRPRRTTPAVGTTRSGRRESILSDSNIVIKELLVCRPIP